MIDNIDEANFVFSMENSYYISLKREKKVNYIDSVSGGQHLSLF